MRRGEPADPEIAPIALSAVGLIGAVVTGWLGGELVDRLGVGVDDGAHLNSPSSLSGRPASEVAEGRTGAPARTGFTGTTGLPPRLGGREAEGSSRPSRVEERGPGVRSEDLRSEERNTPPM
jgi:hypothetical protein